MEATTELKLKNYNNCLACDAFNYITFAPSRMLSENDLEKVYLVKNDDEYFFCKIVDVYRCDFWRMPSIATISATGMEAHEWREWWIRQHPNTDRKTQMIVYQYKKIKI